VNNGVKNQITEVRPHLFLHLLAEHCPFFDGDTVITADMMADIMGFKILVPQEIDRYVREHLIPAIIERASRSSDLVVAQLLFLESQDPDKDIHLYINSPRRHGDRGTGHLRYDAAREAGHCHHLHRTGGFHGGLFCRPEAKANATRFLTRGS
jgi:hypothetical protein